MSDARIDRAFDELNEGFVAANRAGVRDLAFLCNEELEVLTRRDTGENRASVLDNWDNGTTGGKSAPPPGLARYPIPSGDSIRRAAATHIPGEGFSTTSLTDHAFWFDTDGTFDIVAAKLQGEVLE